MVLDRKATTEVLLIEDYRGVRVYQLRGRVKSRRGEDSPITERDISSHQSKYSEGARKLQLGQGVYHE